MNGYLLVLITVVSFAVYPSIAPVGLSAGLTPFGFVYQTMLVSMALMVFASAVRGQRVVPRNRVAVLGLSAVFLLEHLALLYSLRHVEVPVAMAVIYTYPLMVAAVQVKSEAERISPAFCVSLGVCFVGVILVVGLGPKVCGLKGPRSRSCKRCSRRRELLSPGGSLPRRNPSFWRPRCWWGIDRGDCGGTIHGLVAPAWRHGVGRGTRGGPYRVLRPLLLNTRHRKSRSAAKLVTFKP